MADEPSPFLSAIRALSNIRSEGPDPQSSSLESLFKGTDWPPAPPVIKDGWFKNETINIDGYTFEHCRFDRCKLVTAVATFTFRHCFIADDCGLYFTGPALKVARLLMHTLKVKGRLTVLA